MEEIQDNTTSLLKVLMVPWLGHGHVTPYLELAKKLSKTNLFLIYFCSTPVILDSIKQENLPRNIQLVEFPLPSSPDLPIHHHTTKGLPKKFLLTLIHTYGKAGPIFAKILDSVNPDLVIFDNFQPWAPDLASSLKNIPAVQFIIVGSVSVSFFYHQYHLHDDGTTNFPFSGIFQTDYEAKQLRLLTAKLKYCTLQDVLFNGVEKSDEIILVNTCNEIEERYVDFFSSVSKKKVMPVGPLICEMETRTTLENNAIIEWLDKKDESSCVYVSFGSEYFLSEEQIEEIARSLELSEVNFIWVLMSPLGEEISIESVLPKGFLDRVKEKGVIVTNWAPQARILRHASVGGFICHCGWNSVLEGLHYGVPLITMPMLIDQPIHSRMLVELGTAVEVVRDENGKLNREETAKVIRNVVMEKNGGEKVKAKARELRKKIRDKEEEEFDQVVNKLVYLSTKKQQ